MQILNSVGDPFFFIDNNLRVTMLKPNSLSEQVVP